ncbi:TPA: autotransporter outer membrane beta-barrel domain-containing protein [Escherichia coli]
MNTVYKLVWNASQCAWVVASEFSKSGKKSSRKLLVSFVIGSAVLISAAPAMATLSGTQTRTLNNEEVILSQPSDLDARKTGANGLNAWIIHGAAGSDRTKNKVVIREETSVQGGNTSSDGCKGGVGVAISNSTLINNGSVLGGDSGHFGGIAIIGDKATIINNDDGFISGGNGALSGTGIRGRYLNIINSGFIWGGYGGQGGRFTVAGDHLNITNSGYGTIAGAEGGNSAIYAMNSDITNSGSGIIEGSDGESTGGYGIKGFNLNITNSDNAKIYGGYGYNQGGSGIHGRDMTITSSADIHGGNSKYQGGDAINGDNLTITSSGSIYGGKANSNNNSFGGIGIYGNNLYIRNSGKIRGGQGASLGGEGIYASNSNIDNSGSIRGGLGHVKSGYGIHGNNLTIRNTGYGEILGGDCDNDESCDLSKPGGVGIFGSYMTIINGEAHNSIATIGGGASVYGVSGDGISGDHINIINRGFINGGFGYTQSGDAISGSYINIDNSGMIVGGGTASNDFRAHGLAGRAITGDHLTITNSGLIHGGDLFGDDINARGNMAISGSNIAIINSGLISGSNVNGKRSAALNFTGGTNSLTMNNSRWLTSVSGDIILNSVAAGSTEGNSLFITSNITNASHSTVDGSLKAGDSTSVTLSGNKVTFSGDATFGRNISLTLASGMAARGSVTFNYNARVNDAITDWTQGSYDLLSADRGIYGLSAGNISSLLLADGANDYTRTTLSANKLTRSLAWNATDHSAHGEFSLRDGAPLILHTVLADNNSTTHTSGWDGKSLTKSGKGELILAGRNTYSGTTTINGGTLKTATDYAIARSAGVNISDGATLNLNGHNQKLTGIDNRGTLLINDYGASVLSAPVTVSGNMTLRQSGRVIINNGNNAGQTLNLNGDWKSEGGNLFLGAILGDDNSKADQLHISGHASGTTHVHVANLGGSGAQTLEGIKLISTGSSDKDAFIQKGRIVAGSYDYHLQQGTKSGQNTSDWYLTSYYSGRPDILFGASASASASAVQLTAPAHRIRIWRPEAGSYTANLMAANTMFNNSLEDRHGSVVTDPVTGQQYETSFWARAVGGHNTFRMTDGQSKTQANRMVYQIGGEVLTASFSGDDGFHLGGMTGYGNQHSKTINRLTGYSSRGTVSGYAAGLYGTWFSDENTRNGLYIDSSVQYGWFDNTVKGEGLAGEKYNSNGLMASLETGYVYPAFSWKADNGTDNTLYLRPQAQVTWSGVKADDHTECNGTVVKSAGTDNVQTRLGLRVSMTGQSSLDKGSARKFEPYAEVNWLWNSGQYGVTMGDASDHLKGSRNIAELKAGVEGRITDSLGLWGNVAQQNGGHSYSDTQGMVGLKYFF